MSAKEKKRKAEEAKNQIEGEETRLKVTVHEVTVNGEIILKFSESLKT